MSKFSNAYLIIFLLALFSNRSFSNSDLVNVTLFYESFCPYSAAFINNQLNVTFNKISSIMNLKMVPYGNTIETFDEENEVWKYECQHEEDECWGNLFQTCLINKYPNAEQHFRVIECIEGDDADIETSSIKCSNKFNVDYKVVKECLKSRFGNALQHENALLTSQLDPPHEYVPLLQINGDHSETIQDAAHEDLTKLICVIYKGNNKPAECNN